MTSWENPRLGLQAQELQCPIMVVTIHSRNCSRVELEQQTYQSDHYLDPKQEWPDLSGVCADGAVLVRPDGHVLWRLQSLREAGGAHVQQPCTRDLASDKESAAASDYEAGFVVRDDFELHHIASALKPAMQRCLGRS